MRSGSDRQDSAALFTRLQASNNLKVLLVGVVYPALAEIPIDLHRSPKIPGKRVIYLGRSHGSGSEIPLALRYDLISLGGSAVNWRHSPVSGW